MNKTILFSPIGGTDPISQNNLHDGALLHICRWYQPDEVYMYMSKEILDFQAKDDRYRFCLNRLSEKTGHPMIYHEIEKPELEKVYDFNFFYNDFKKEIDKIITDADDSDTILLNISSGTPAMKSGLLVLATLLEYRCKLIQVVTPTGKMNEHNHDEDDIELLWELDEDNKDDAEKRCEAVYCPSLTEIQQKDIIKKHVTNYDYKAALDVAEILSDESKADFIDMLHMARCRQLLAFNVYGKYAGKSDADFLPVKSGNERNYFEYALELQCKLKRGEYADFIRGVTPIVADLFELILKERCGVDMQNYYRIDKKSGAKRWNDYIDADMSRALRGDFEKSVEGNVVGSAALMNAILYYSDDVQLKALVQEVREIEEKVRNVAAHQIVSINASMIKEKTGRTTTQIMQDIKRLFAYTNIRIKKNYWNSYDEMNDTINCAIDRSSLQME
ncbi:MAG: type III-A CRISPR-associated CARF protein Csm6 [Candidatus Weimeria sp.]